MRFLSGRKEVELKFYLATDGLPDPASRIQVSFLFSVRFHHGWIRYGGRVHGKTAFGPPLSSVCGQSANEQANCIIYAQWKPQF